MCSIVTLEGHWLDQMLSVVQCRYQLCQLYLINFDDFGSDSLLCCMAVL